MSARTDQIWDPYNYLENIPGKGMRSVHIDAFNSVLLAPDKVVSQVKLVVQQLHTTSLLMDDVEDDAILRRGRPVAHSIFGIPRTINTASFVMLSALRQAIDNFPSCSEVLFDELQALHIGQGLDLYWRDTHKCPSEEEYEHMVKCKTGGLYRLAVKLLQSASSTSFDLVPLADCLGLIYQIQDDLLNLECDNYSANKGFAEDITEGKYSFPVVHCLTHGSNAAAVELSNILMQHTNDKELKQHALRILEQEGSLDYTIDTIRTHYNHARELINSANIPDASLLYRLLEKLVEPSLSSERARK